MSRSAKEAFKEMLRDDLGPALRSVGLKGSGSSYAIPSQSHWAQIGLQRSTFNTADRVKFTVNCKVVRRDVWAAASSEQPYRGASPKPNVHYGTFEWTERIGKLMPGGEDHWWCLDTGDDAATLAAEVVAAITTYAIPAMVEQIAETIEPPT